MEDHRNDFAVIVTGYGDEMAECIESNPGLRSRFKTCIHSADYTPPELTQILAAVAKASRSALGDGVWAKAESVFQQTPGAPHLGSARLAPMVIEEAYARMSIRDAADRKIEFTELAAIAPEDIEWKGGGVERDRRRAGFPRGDPRSVASPGWDGTRPRNVIPSVARGRNSR